VPLPRRLRTLLAALAVGAAALAGAVGTLAVVDSERSLSVGTIEIGVSPGHHGALDLYVPLVDWGARFDGVRLPARLKVEVRSINREVVARVAEGHSVDVEAVRREARDAIAGYIRRLLILMLLGGLALGGLVALALRGRHTLPLRAGMAVAVATSVAAVTLTAVLLPPRGRIADPTYYAHGPDLPRALEALQAVRRSQSALDQELNAQLVGLARLVVEPGRHEPLSGRPRLVVASDLHNNLLALPLLERAASGLPLVLAGDLTDRGSDLEAGLLRRVARIGRPTVVVGGNHDSDALLQRLARAGAIVLTERGRLRGDGSHGELVVRVGGLRMAGYTDPFLRRAGERFRDRFRAGETIAAQEAFRRWAERLEGKVDVIVVHEPEVAAKALEDWRSDPPRRPIMVLVGHTHRPAVRAERGLLEVNGGTIGAGGTGNLADERSDLSLAIVTYRLKPTVLPLAVDQVSIDPGSGSSTARRLRVDRTVRGGERPARDD